MTLDQLESVLGHVFADRAFLLEALTHKTWLKEEQDRGRALGLRDQQRLEYLGDAFLGYEVGRHLYDRFPDANEGDLTARRRALVKGRNIHEVGQRLGVLDLVRVGEGEHSKLHRNKKVVEDTVEALVGAVLMDATEAEARRLVRRLFLADLREEVAADAISTFNQRWQQRFRQSPPEPDYDASGPDDARSWTAEVLLPEGGVVIGEGATQKEARRDACARALKLWPDLE